MNVEIYSFVFHSYIKYRVTLCIYSSDCSAMEAQICCNGKLITGEDEREEALKQSARFSFHFIQMADNIDN